MSAQINSLATHPSRSNTIPKISVAENALDLSVITRIDYNLRFTKQAVLVASNSSEVYSKLANQYLGHLSDSTDSNSPVPINVAYLSASNKLNDLQVRCRLVEQLFVNSLFDPEQSLAVSILQFAKQQNESISIVIEHAQALSLQITYEITQLVHQAKKHNISVNVILFGLIEAGEQLAVNKALFKNKIAIIDAHSGQIINLNDNKIQPKRKNNKIHPAKLMSLVALILVIGLGSTGVYLLVANSDKTVDALVTSLLKPEESAEIKQSTQLPLDKQNQLILPSTHNDQHNGQMISADKSKMLNASGHEIYTALLSPSNQNERLKPAESADIIKALTTTKTVLAEKSINPEDSEESNSKITTISDAVGATVIKNETTSLEHESARLNGIEAHYYQNQAVVFDQGYVIQVANFSTKELWLRFTQATLDIELHSYERLLNSKKLYVVTSKVFATKAEAKQALTALPKSITDRKPWLKDISSVINEINTLKL